MSAGPRDAEVPVDELTSTGDLADVTARRERFAELTVKKRELKTEERETNAELEKLEERVLDDYAELGTDSMRTLVGEQRYTVHLAPECRAGPLKSGVDDDGEESSTDEDWARACAALKAAGWGHLVREQFNHNALSGHLAEFIREHGPNWRGALPDEVTDALRISVRQRVRCRKA